MSVRLTVTRAIYHTLDWQTELTLAELAAKTTCNKDTARVIVNVLVRVHALSVLQTGYGKGRIAIYAKGPEYEAWRNRSHHDARKLLAARKKLPSSSQSSSGQELTEFWCSKSAR